MKRRLLYAMLAAVMAVHAASCEKETIVSEADLPAPSRAFIATHFEGTPIASVVKERENLTVGYTVWLANGFEVAFTQSGDWDDVDGKISPVPESVIALLPPAIPAYVSSSFAGAFIVEINKERYGYEAGLSNDTELKFSADGALLGID